MECENIFCIYWEKCSCILESITLDIQGSCQECIYVNIEKDILHENRERARRSFETVYSQWDKKDGDGKK